MNIAILLAAGSGKRMKSDIPKQFLEIDGKMIFKHSLDVFENSEVIDGVVVVTDKDHVSFVEDETTEYEKVKAVILGESEKGFWKIKCRWQLISGKYTFCMFSVEKVRFSALFTQKTRKNHGFWIKMSEFSSLSTANPFLSTKKETNHRLFPRVFAFNGDY